MIVRLLNGRYTITMSLWLPYTQMQTVLPPLNVVRTDGCYLFLEDGRKLIDAMASWWTACHGYNHPYLIESITQQAHKLPHVMLGGLIHPQAQTLADRLCQLLPASLAHVFFSESGSVAVEVAMKMALQYWMNQNQGSKTQFLCFQHGYHGDTFYTMSVCDPKEGMHRLFHSVLPKQHCHPLPTTGESLAALEQMLNDHSEHLAGCLIEPLVQGAGGMKMHTTETLDAIVTLCRKYDVLVIMDEIFTGFGRTGSMFAFEQSTSTPDILCLSKALTGGMLPLAATLASDTIFKAFLGDAPEKALMHGTTFMGNALACAAANASLDLFEQAPRLAQVAAIETQLHDALSPLVDVPGVKAVRVKGAIGAVQCEAFSESILNWFKAEFSKQGIACRPFGDIVYTTPAFTIESDQLAQITDSITTLIQQWSSQFYRK
jgi:adenosylmethionine---8-amino-7-oxononanoate aminotransferase